MHCKSESMFFLPLHHATQWLTNEVKGDSVSVAKTLDHFNSVSPLIQAVTKELQYHGRVSPIIRYNNILL